MGRRIATIWALGVVAGLIIGVFGAYDAMAATPTKQVTALKAQVAKLKKRNAKQVRSIRTLRRQKATVTRQLTAATVTLETLDAKLDQVLGEHAQFRSLVEEKSRRAVELEASVASVVVERDSARADLATAQSGVNGAVTTLSPEQGFAILPNLFRRFGDPDDRWSADYFKSVNPNGETSYESYCFVDTH